MATIGLGFQLSANATQMSSGINAGVTELQKLGYAAKKTSQDVSILKNIELSRLFLSGVQAAAASFQSFIAGSAAAVAAVDDLSKRTGVSTQTIQAYQFAAEQSGVGIETFGKSIQKLGINLGEAQTGNKAAIKSFTDLGLSVEELARLSPQQQFEAVAAAIAQLPNPAQQAAAAVSVFGKAGAQLVPVFKEGVGFLAGMRVEAERLGLVLGDTQVASLAALDDSLGKVSATFQAFQARITAELAPALISAAESASDFIASLDVQQIARSAESAVASLANAFGLVVNIATPLVRNLLPGIGGYLAFINRQAITFVTSQIAQAMYTAAAAALGYAGSAKQAATATAIFATTMRGFLISTGVGALVVAFGVAAGALVDWGLSAANAGDDVQAALQASQEEAARLIKPIDDATGAARRFGVEAEKAFKLPAEITDRTLLQGTVEDAAQAFKKFAAEAGGLGNIPRELGDAFESLQADIDNVNGGFIDTADGQKLIRQSAEQVLKIVGDITKARKDEEDATKRVADAAARASEEARKRAEELAAAGVSDAEKSRLTLQKDLLAIQQAVADAEKQLADARAANDSNAIRAAQERLAITRETAKAAEGTAREQAKQRNLEARGLSSELFKPARTLEDQLRSLKDAVQANDITREQGNLGFNRLIERGLQIRKEISRELSRPAQRALEIQDVRTSAGISEFVRLATGRDDPAVEQNRDQLKELKEIRTAIKNVFPLAIVDI